MNYLPERAVSGIKVSLSEPGFRPREAELLVPGASPRKLELARDGERWSVTVPELAVYGLLVLR